MAKIYSNDALKRLLKLTVSSASVYPVRAVSILFVIIAAQTCILVVPLMLRRMVDAFTDPQLVVLDVVTFCLWYVVPIVAARFFCWMLWRVSGFMASTLQPRMMRDLQSTAFRALLRQSYSYFADSFTGTLVGRAKSLFAVRECLETVWWSVLPLCVSVFGSMIILAFQSRWLSLGIAIWVAIIIAANFVFSKYKLRFDAIRAAKYTQATGVISDALTNSVNIKLFSAQEEEEGRVQRVMEEWRKAQTIAWRVGEKNILFQNIANIAFELILMTMMIYLWKDGQVSVGDLVLVQTTLMILFNSSYDIGRVIRRLYEAAADALEMMDLLEAPIGIVDKTKKQLDVRRARIDFQNVLFTYQKKQPVLDELSLSVRSKEKIALVGASGAGKSTIVKLLFRFYDLDRGKILIDGQDISRVTQDSLRQVIALVPQEPILFHRSLKENISYSRRGASLEEIVEAAKKAHCHEFISELPQGYDTLVGERGIKLSGGERQRIAIARAILKNAPILVLDEATSSLDSESEALIQDALRGLMKNKTVIVIAHRLSTIMQMDRIIVMEDGRVVDQGTHQALLSKVGIYQKLWNIQAGGFGGV